MRRLYTAQITKYNLEEWYPKMEQVAAELGLTKGFTPKVYFYFSHKKQNKFGNVKYILFCIYLGFSRVYFYD